MPADPRPASTTLRDSLRGAASEPVSSANGSSRCMRTDRGRASLTRTVSPSRHALVSAGPRCAAGQVPRLNGPCLHSRRKLAAVRPGLRSAKFARSPAPVAEIIDGMTGTQRSSSPETAQYWPVAGLRLRLELPHGSAGADLELRPPDDADLTALAGLAEAGIHDPAVQPFAVAWTDA